MKYSVVAKYRLGPAGRSKMVGPTPHFSKVRTRDQIFTASLQKGQNLKNYKKKVSVKHDMTSNVNSRNGKRT